MDSIPVGSLWPGGGKGETDLDGISLVHVLLAHHTALSARLVLGMSGIECRLLQCASTAKQKSHQGRGGFTATDMAFRAWCSAADQEFE